MVLRARRGDPEAVAGVASAIRAATAPLPATALRLGEVVGGSGAADALAALGLPDGVLVPAVIDGHTEGALALLPRDGAEPGRPDIAAGRAAAALIALGMRTDTLVRGLADRARELDRQSRRLGALTRVAQRLAEAPTAAAARHVTVAEARALAGADAAALLVPGPGGRGRGARPRRGRARPGGSRRRRGRRGRAARRAWRGTWPWPRWPTRRAPWRSPGGAARPSAPATSSACRGSPPRPPWRSPAAPGRRPAARAGRATGAGRGDRPGPGGGAAAGGGGHPRRPRPGAVGLGLMLDALVARPARRRAGRGRRGHRRRPRRPARRCASCAARSATCTRWPSEELGFAAATRALVQRLEWRGIAVSVDVGAADALSETRADRRLPGACRRRWPTSCATPGRPRGDRARGPRAADVVVEVARRRPRLRPGDRRRARLEDGHLGLAAIEERAALAGGACDDRLRRGPGHDAPRRPPRRRRGRAQRAGGPEARQRRRQGVLVREAELDHHLTVLGRAHAHRRVEGGAEAPPGPRRPPGWAPGAAAGGAGRRPRARQVLGRAHGQPPGHGVLGDPQAAGGAVGHEDRAAVALGEGAGRDHRLHRPRAARAGARGSRSPAGCARGARPARRGSGRSPRSGSRSAWATSIGVRSSRTRFSTSASSSRSRSSTARTTAGTRGEPGEPRRPPAALAGDEQVAPAPGRAARRRPAGARPLARIEAASASRAAASMPARGWSGLGAIASSGSSPGRARGGGSAAGASASPSSAASPRPRPRRSRAASQPRAATSFAASK